MGMKPGIAEGEGSVATSGDFRGLPGDKSEGKVGDVGERCVGVGERTGFIVVRAKPRSMGPKSEDGEQFSRD